MYVTVYIGRISFIWFDWNVVDSNSQGFWFYDEKEDI